MSKPKIAADPYKRTPTRHRGVSYRVRSDGSRTYSVYFEGRYLPVEGGEGEAIAKQAELRGKAARGERIVVGGKTTFGDLAEQWYEARAVRLRPRTARYYRDALDLVLLPRFGNLRIAAVDADAVAKLVRDLERQGLHAIDRKRPVRPLGRSSVENYLKPCQGVLKLATRRGLISSNPFAVLTDDERPKREERQTAHEWTPEAVSGPLSASERLARKGASKYDYSPLLKLVATLGLRLGEVLGLRWEDFDKDEGALYVRRKWLISGEYGPTKTAAGNRRIAIPTGLRDELIALRVRSRFSLDEDPIFASTKGTPLGHRNVTRRGFEPAAEAAKLGGVTFHDLRHAAASRLIRGGLDPVSVASVLGHEDPNITLRVYAHLYDRQRTDEAIRAALATG